MSTGPSKLSFESEESARLSVVRTESQESGSRSVRFGNAPFPVSSRRRSIQFDVEESDRRQRPSLSSTHRSHSATGEQDKGLSMGRTPSPPPPSTYERGVSFDTFESRDDPNSSFTLNYKHKAYQPTRRGRTFLCGTDQNDYSDFALEWLMDELVEDGDEIVCVRVIEKDSPLASEAAIDKGKYHREGQKLLDQVIEKNSHDEKAISLVLELAIGKVQEVIQNMIRLHQPTLLVVGTRGRSLNSMQSLFPGSVSKYCLQHSPIPVIVVRPTTKREKKKRKRLADPTRRSYTQIMELSERRGSHIFDVNSTTKSGIEKLPDEENAVAEALGLPRGYRSPLPLENVSPRSSISHDDQEVRVQNFHSLDAILMDGPEDATERPPAEEVSLESLTETTDFPQQSCLESRPSASESPTTVVVPSSPAKILSDSEDGEHLETVQSPEPLKQGEEPTTATERMSIPVIVTEDLSTDSSTTAD